MLLDLVAEPSEGNDHRCLLRVVDLGEVLLAELSWGRLTEHLLPWEDVDVLVEPEPEHVQRGDLLLEGHGREQDLSLRWERLVRWHRHQVTDLSGAAGRKR